MAVDKVETGSVVKKAKVSPCARNSRANMQESSDISSVPDHHQTIDENTAKNRQPQIPQSNKILLPLRLERLVLRTKKKPKASGYILA